MTAQGVNVRKQGKPKASLKRFSLAKNICLLQKEKESTAKAQQCLHQRQSLWNCFEYVLLGFKRVD
jgi:hypothetical protein